MVRLLFHATLTSTAAIPAQKYMQHTSTTADLNPLPQPKPALYPAPTLYFRLRNKRNILPLQQNPSQLSLFVLLGMYLHRIINHQIHKLVESLLISTRATIHSSPAHKPKGPKTKERNEGDVL